MPDPLPAPPATFPLRLPGVAWWACFLCVFMLRRSRFFCLALIRLAGARRRPCTVRNGRWALPLKRLPSTPLLTGLPPRFFRHWRRSAPPPRPGAAAPGPRKAYQGLFSRLLRPLVWLRPPFLAQLPRRSCSRRPVRAISFFREIPPPLLLPRPPRSLKQGRNGPQGRSFAPLPGRDIARRAPLGFGLLVLGADFCPALGWVQGAAMRRGGGGTLCVPQARAFGPGFLFGWPGAMPPGRQTPPPRRCSRVALMIPGHIIVPLYGF